MKEKAGQEKKQIKDLDLLFCYDCIMNELMIKLYRQRRSRQNLLMCSSAALLKSLTVISFSLARLPKYSGLAGGGYI